MTFDAKTILNGSFEHHRHLHMDQLRMDHGHNAFISHLYILVFFSLLLCFFSSFYIMDRNNANLNDDEKKVEAKRSNRLNGFQAFLFWLLIDRLASFRQIRSDGICSLFTPNEIWVHSMLVLQAKIKKEIKKINSKTKVALRCIPIQASTIICGFYIWFHNSHSACAET